MDYTQLNPPGVYTESTAGPQIGIQANTPSSVGIFGRGRGYRTDLETVVIPADFVNAGDSSISATLTPFLRQKGIDISTIKVVNLATGTLYARQTVTSPPNGDYVVVPTNGPSGVLNGPDSQYKIKRVIGSALDDEVPVQISYQFTDSTYFEAQTFYDYDDVISFYGAPFDSTGTITSELSLACKLAFDNGARTVVASVVNVSGSAQTSDYSAALKRLEGISSIAIVVAATGNKDVFSAVRDHVVAQSNQKNERRAVLGTDGSVTQVTSSQKISFARGLTSDRVALVSLSSVKYYNSAISSVQTIGGQFLAAALAGMAVSKAPAKPLTRESVAGFVGTPENTADAQKTAETAAGLMVVEPVGTTGLRVRHGVTTSPSSLISREWSFLGQQDAMSYRLRAAFEADGLIGSNISDTTLANVKASASSALEGLVDDGVIKDYRSLKVRQNANALDAIEIGYEWGPFLPLNYVVVRFTLNVTSGQVSDTSTTSL